VYSLTNPHKKHWLNWKLVLNSEYKSPTKYIERRQTTIILVIKSGVKGPLITKKKNTTRVKVKYRWATLTQWQTRKWRSGHWPASGTNWYMRHECTRPGSSIRAATFWETYLVRLLQAVPFLWVTDCSEMLVPLYQPTQPYIP
jgi:hypothetical protein